MRKRTKALSIAAGALILALVMPQAAQAANYNVTGELNISGYLIQYGTYRPHSVGPASLNITSNVVGGTGGGSTFGLRNTADTQVTTSRDWINGSSTNTGSKAFANATTLTSTIPTQTLAVNGRMMYVGGGYYNIGWTGILTQ